MVHGNDVCLRWIERQIDTLTVQLWGLTDKELAEIWRSLTMLETRR